MSFNDSANKSFSGFIRKITSGSAFRRDNISIRSLFINLNFSKVLDALTSIKRILGYYQIYKYYILPDRHDNYSIYGSEVIAISNREESLDGCSSGFSAYIRP